MGTSVTQTELKQTRSSKTRWRDTALLLTFAALIATSCTWEPSCRWDEHLRGGASYEIELLERYAESTTTTYDPSLDLTRPAPSCGVFDEVAAGQALTVRLQERPISLACSLWNAEVTDPPVSLGPRLSLIINNRSYNQLVASTRRDFGDGCVGSWELSVHAPEDDPFAEQVAGALPVVLAYRVFVAAPEGLDACAALLGREPPEGAAVICGDAFVASMSEP